MTEKIRAQSWQTCDSDIKNFVLSLVKGIREELGSKLVGVYLLGSLATGSYYRPKSDIDFIVVVESKLSPDTRSFLAEHIATISETRPTVGNVELTVVTQSAVKNLVHPCPFEVHYSSEWHEQIMRGEMDYAKERTDVDLAAQVLWVLQRGVVLHGPAIEFVFGDVPWEIFWEAVRNDTQWILDSEHILETPFYAVLNVCRVIRTLTEQTHTLYNKVEGAEWGVIHLPSEFKPIVSQALAVYRSNQAIASDQRRTGGMKWDREELLAFRDYAREALTSLSNN